jgi:hypothetical protein
MLAPSRLPSPQGEPSLALPRSFWKDFTKRHWDREPARFQGLFPAHFPTTGEIYEALLDANMRLSRGEAFLLRTIRLYLEHEEGPNGMPFSSMIFPLHKYHLPVPEDGSLQGYVERITHQMGGKRFGLVLNRTQCHHWGHWQQMQSFLSGLYESVGVPLGGGDSALFVGNYRYTPFGLHKDHLHVFYFVIEGKKTISLWPFDALSQRDEVPKFPNFINESGGITIRDKAEEQELLAKARFLEGRPGDLLYWPASHWHRAEPSEGLAIAASLGVSFRPPMFTEMGTPGPWPHRLRLTDMPRARHWQVPVELRTAIQQRAQRKSLITQQSHHTTEWVRLLSASALGGSAPLATEAPLTPQDWIRASPKRPIVSVLLPEKKLLVSANGHSTALPASPTVRRRVEKLLATLNEGKPQQVEALEAGFFSRLPARAFTRRAFRALLDDLVRWHGVHRCEPSSARARAR